MMRTFVGLAFCNCSVPATDKILFGPSTQLCYHNVRDLALTWHLWGDSSFAKSYLHYRNEMLEASASLPVCGD